ncbi:adenosylcobinamide kinase [Butyrivibrio sp. CB08]|uniref:bifunctional adenosylcobinamide kinase/adenosylcobinamide-phosphate guanylyltransferase n=1 Tax=Butyrivibrio sp. CB08 TaxID=2364879 RepID=UPI000EA935F5|nr:bifunctional adenosylcobinamide kinase/adenosylcobinamide-phosphate guanylyltransferase [Butyrivibrio sp. CB08]RKM59752.1 adenosylcobinamide kinase [Butyrivibrio sp. CB08]
MITLVVGVPNSGKSALAESLVMEQSESDKRIYIATMIPFGEEGDARVKKHQKLREGKGFFTVEAPVDVAGAASKVAGIEDSTFLLECVSNLVGNVMHEDGAEVQTQGKEPVKRSDEDVVSKVVSDIKALSGMCKNLVIVTNSFPMDGEGYDEDTRRYARLVALVNEKLRDLADKIYEYSQGKWREHEHN